MEKHAQAIREAVADKKGQFGMTMVVLVDAPFRGKTNNPFYGRTKKLATITNTCIGCNYSNCVNGKLERKGIEPNFKAQPCNTIYVDEFINRNKAGDKLYLKYGHASNTHEDCVYYVDGRLATDEEMAQITPLLREKSAPQTQISAGLTEQESFGWRIVTVTNVVSITQGVRELYHRDNLSPEPQKAVAE